MSILGEILSTVSSIGRIAGALSGVIGGSPEFQNFGRTSTPLEVTLGQAVFFNNENGDTTVLNNSTQSTLSLFFMGDEDTPSTEMFVPPATTLPLSPTFQTYSTADCDEFIIMPVEPVVLSSTGLPPGLPGPVPDAIIGAQVNQPILPNVSTNISANINVQVVNITERVLLFTLGGGLIVTTVVLCNFRGAGSTLIRIINAIRGNAGGLATSDDPQQFSISIPPGIDITDGLMYLNVVIAVAGFQNVLQAWIENHAELLAPVSDEDRVRLASFAAAQR